MYHTIATSPHALVAASPTTSPSATRPSSWYFPVLHEEHEEEVVVSSSSTSSNRPYFYKETDHAQHHYHHRNFNYHDIHHHDKMLNGCYNTPTNAGGAGATTGTTCSTTIVEGSSSLFSNSESEESLSTSTDVGDDCDEDDDEEDDDDDYDEDDVEMEDLGSSIESITSFHYHQHLSATAASTYATTASTNLEATTTTSMALEELERNLLVAAADRLASNRSSTTGSSSRYISKGSFSSRRLLLPPPSSSSCSSSSNSSCSTLAQQHQHHHHHCSKKTKKSHHTVAPDDQSVCSMASVASSSSAILGDSFQSTLRVSSPHPAANGNGVIRSTSPYVGTVPFLTQQHHSTAIPPLQSPAVEFQFLVKLRERTYSLCFPVWCPPPSTSSTTSSSTSCGKRTHPWSSLPYHHGSYAPATTTTSAASTSTTTTTATMPFLLPSAWQICAALSAKTNIPIHLLQLNDEDIPYSEMQRVLLHPRSTSSSHHDGPSSTGLKKPLHPTFQKSSSGGTTGQVNNNDDPCHVFFLNAKLKVHIRGGKGGFGSLLKGQSKQAAAKTTLDFGSCRDLSGRRLRHINDEIKLRKWREAMEAKARGETINEEEHYRTKSGIRNWYLDIPNWALEAFSQKSQRAEERRIKRDILRKVQEEEEKRLYEQERKRARDRAIMSYIGPALQPTDSRSMEDAIAQGMAKRRRKQQVAKISSVLEAEVKSNLFNPQEKVFDAAKIYTKASNFPVAVAKGTSDESSNKNDIATAGMEDHNKKENNDTIMEPTPDEAKEILLETTFLQDESWFCTLSGEFATEENTTNDATASTSTISQTPGLVSVPNNPEAQKTTNSESLVSKQLPSKMKWELLVQSKSDFATGCILLPNSSNTRVHHSLRDGELINGKWYYEVKLQETAGMAQIGWACNSKMFHPNCDTGDGVGDDQYSYGYDGSRSLIFHVPEAMTTSDYSINSSSTRRNATNAKSQSNTSTISSQGSERSYGPRTPWKAYDVIGCMFDADNGEISFSINGKDLGVAFQHHVTTSDNAAKKEQTNKRGLFPALSLNEKEIVLVNAGPQFEYLPQGYRGINEVLLDNSTTLAPSTTSVEENLNKKNKTNEAKLNTSTNAQLEEETKLKEELKSFDVSSFQLDTYNSVNDLEKLGPDRLKHILIFMNVKCGGTLNDRAKRLFSLKGLQRKDYPLKVRAKNFIP